MKKIWDIVNEGKIKSGLNAYDIAYIAGAVMLSFLLIAGTKYYFKDNKSQRAVIKYDNKEIISLDLKEDKTIILRKEKYHLLLGDMQIEVRDGKIGVTKEKSPNHYCSRMGFVGESTKPIICQPNKVMIYIERGKDKSEDIDLEAY